MEPDKKIIQFIDKHHVLTLATASTKKDGLIEPYCSNMFYVYLPNENIFVFSSALQTKHIEDVNKNPIIAASIVLESKVVGNLQGLQIQGHMMPLDTQRERVARKAYFFKFPYAAAMTLNLWLIEPTFMKLTDNRLGFGKKIIWTADE